MASMRTIGVRLRLLVGDYKKDADDAGKSTDQLASKIQGAGKKSKADLDKIAMGAGIAGAALFALAGAAVIAAARFDKQMSEVGAVADASAADMDRLRKAAIDAGQATVFSATEAAQAEAELAKAGIKTSDILGGALAGSLSLAAAGSLDLADSAEIAAAAMNTFNLGGDQVEHIADVLAAAANKSAAGVDDLGQGLQQVGLIAAQVGLSLEETVALLAAFADRGLKGSDGATSLKTALMRLASPTGAAKELMKQLGISLYDSNGQMVDAVTIAGQLQKGLTNLTPAQRNAALQTIFGSDAIRAANILYAEGADGIQDYVNAVNDQGAAARVAQEKLNNLSGDVEQLTGSLETLFIQSGEGASGGLRTLVQGATDLVNVFAGLPGGVQSSVVVIAGLSGAALLASAAYLKFRGVLGETLLELEKTGPAGTKAARGIETATKWAGRATVAFVALELVSSGLNAAFGTKLNPNVEALSADFEVLAQGGQAGAEATRLFGKDLEHLGLALMNANSAGKDFSLWMESLPIVGQAGQEFSWTNNIERVKAFDSALAKLVQDGHAAEAAAEVRQAEEAGAKWGITTEQLLKLFPEYTAALKGTAESTEEVADDTAKAAINTLELARAELAAAKEGETLIDVWDRLHGKTLSADEAMLAARDTVDAVAESFRKNGRSIEGNTRAALENRIALEKNAQAAAAAADAYLEQGGSAEGAQRILDQFKESAIRATGATGKAKDEVRALADSLFSLKDKTVNVNVQIKTPSERSLEIAGQHVTIYRRWGGITQHAADGLVNAGIYSAQSPARYAFAEPQTGGEAFVPKRGDYGRSMSILSAAAGWYNADVVPRDGWYGGSSSSMPAAMTLTVRPAPGADRAVMSAIVDGLRFEVDTQASGSAEQYFTSRRRRS